jgi:uracil-DNA glycosylase
MSVMLPKPIRDAVLLADPSWQSILVDGLDAMTRADPDYLVALAADDYLPTSGRIFAAFKQPLDAVRYVLVGEGPYPRELSATGLCFMDGAVGSLWSDKGLSKPVNRATSLRNFIKMLLVAAGHLSIEHTTGEVMTLIANEARAPGSPFIQTLAELQHNLTQHGFLLLNATLVFRPHVPPVKEAKAWYPFLQTILSALAAQQALAPVTLVLWGKIAEQLNVLPATACFPKVLAEHPYNLSFIGNAAMQSLFGPMDLLQKTPLTSAV